MKLEQRRLIDQALTSEQPCLGAVFCSYTFEPAYFEDHVLRAVLRLAGDPDEDAVRYHEEARAALQETPVACLVDASVRRPGRRLPYDVHLVRRRTFHPKVFLLLYESEARLAVGSGNITQSGLEQNTELFFLRPLSYDNPADVALLLEVDAFLGECLTLAGTDGSQLALIRDTLANRLREAPRLAPGAARDVQFVSSFDGRVLDRLREAIPPQAQITRIGVLAPFFEQDDLSVASPSDGMQAALGELLTLRETRDVELDLGVPWDDAPIAAPVSAQAPSLDERPGALWAWRQRVEVDGKPVERLDYLTVTAASAKRIACVNAAGQNCRFTREELEQAIDEGRLWPVARPVVHAPKTLLQRIAEEHRVRLWLHPSMSLTPSCRVSRRPLHAKALLITAVHAGRVSTHALLGSANASRAALCRGVEQGGNVEACILCRFDGEVTLRDLLPSLVHYTLPGVQLLEREAIEPGVDLSAWIEEAVHDAAAQTLAVKWRDDGPAPLGPWALHYLEQSLASGGSNPSAITSVEGFTLDAASAELTLLAGGDEWPIPIRVLDLAALPTNSLLGPLGLRELLALLGRRLTSNRLAALSAQRGPAGVSTVLDAVFGEGFGPTDVFRAWWGSVEDLKLAATVAAFRHRLFGPTGLCTAWQHLRDVGADQLSPDEVWVYGCELLRELRGLELPPGADTPTKQALLVEVHEQLARELAARTPRGGEGAGEHSDGHDGEHDEHSSEQHDEHSWLDAVRQFYRIGGDHGRA